jgi:hypothetical protein
LSEFNKEQEAFIKGKKNGEPALPPWAGYPDEEALKAEILSLSTVRHTQTIVIIENGSNIIHDSFFFFFRNGEIS